MDGGDFLWRGFRQARSRHLGLGGRRASLGHLRLARSPRPTHTHTHTRPSIALTLLFGIPASTIVARESGRHDPQFVVIDEVSGQWIALLFSPFDWRHALIALILFRLFDITKPFPVRQLENLPEGWGIVLDDVGAGLYALGVASLLRIWFH
jgi:phosphatidylglycerophosphatase A